MSSDNELKIIKSGNSTILFDAKIIAEPAKHLFSRDYHTNLSSQQSDENRLKKSGLEVSEAGQNSGGIGRAPVVYFTVKNKSFVLKHYFRGGAIASILKDHYLGLSVIKSRAFREFRLLKKLSKFGLPVPVAVAAHVKKGFLSYQADLITEELKNVETLSDVLASKVLSDESWKKLGHCIKQFHQKEVYHADLNARNILLTTSADIYLIDFDNSYIRLGSSSWKMANLARLKRSLLKFKNKSVENSTSFNFDEKNWEALLSGYGGMS